MAKIIYNSRQSPIPLVDLNGDAPGINTTLAWSEGDGDIAVCPNAVVTSRWTGTIASVSVNVGGILDEDESIEIGATAYPLDTTVSNTAVVSGTTWNVSYNSVTKIFSITPNGASVASVAAAQALIRDLRYDNTTPVIASGQRTLTITVTSEVYTSHEAIGYIDAVALPINSPPEIDLNGVTGGADNTISYNEGDPATALAPAATITDADVGDELQSMEIQCVDIQGDTERLEINGDIFDLHVTSSTTVSNGSIDFTGSYSSVTQKLTLVPLVGATASVANFQSLLRAVKYENTSAPIGGGDRSFVIRVNDLEDWSPTVTATVNVYSGDVPILTHPGYRAFARGQTIATVPISNTGAAGTYTITSGSLPTGLSLNPSTGNITGTVGGGATLGESAFTVTCTNGGGTDSVDMKFRIHAAKTDINSASGMTTLSTTDQLYRLTGNITVDESAFLVGANNVSLDLNGYTVSYANNVSAELTNHGFESGDFTGWDTTDASDAAVITSTYLSGDVAEGTKACQVVVPAGETRTLRTLASLSVTQNLGYAVTFFCDRQSGSRIDVRIAGTANEKLNLTQNKPGTIHSWYFRPASSGSGVLEIVFNNTTAASLTYRLDRVKFGRCRLHGVIAAGADPATWTPNISGSNFTNFWLVNGDLTEGNATNHDSGCVFGRGAHGLVVSGVNTTKLSTAAESGHPLYLINTQTFEIADNEFTNQAEWVRHRELYDGCTILNGTPASGGLRYIRRNRFIGSPHSCIKTGNSLTAVAGTVITDNTFIPTSKYTNGWAVVYADDDGVALSHTNERNVVDCSSAGNSTRGLYADNGVNVSFSDATVVVRERSINQEYGGYVLGGAYGTELENTCNGVSYDNCSFTVVGESGGGALRLKSEDCQNISVTDCTFVIDQDADPQDSAGDVANCIKSDDTALSEVTITGCIFRSNCGLLSHGGILNTGELVLDDCTFQFVDAGYAHPTYTVSGTTTSSTYTLLNPTYIGAETKTWLQDNNVHGQDGTDYDQLHVRAKQTVTITCVNGSAVPQAGVSVTVKTITLQGDTTVLSGTTNGSGQLTGDIVDWEINSRILTVYGTHRVTTNYGGGTYHEINVSETARAFTLDLDAPDTPPVEHSLAPSKDTFVKGGASANTNYGTRTTFEIKNDATLGNTRKALLAFDLTAVGGCTYGKIELEQTTSSTVEDTYELWGMDVEDDAAWSESTVTWNNAPGNSTTSTNTIDATKATLLATTTQAASASNGSKIVFESSALNTYLDGRAGDSQVTFWLLRNNVAQQTNMKQYAANDHLTASAPLLYIEE